MFSARPSRYSRRKGRHLFCVFLSIATGSEEIFADAEEHSQIYTIDEQLAMIDVEFLNRCDEVLIQMLFCAYSHNASVRHSYRLTFADEITLNPVYNVAPFVVKNARVHRANIYGFNEQKNVVQANRPRYEFVVTAVNSLGLEEEDYNLLYCYYFNILAEIIDDDCKLVPQYAHFSYECGAETESECARDYLRQSAQHAMYFGPVVVKITLPPRRIVFKRGMKLTEHKIE